MRLFFTLLLSSLSTYTLGQYQIRAATLTDNTNRESSGFVKYYDWDRSPESIEFGEDSLSPMNSVLIRNMHKLLIKDGPLYESMYLKVPYYHTEVVSIGHSIIEYTDSTYYLAELLLDSKSVKLYRFFDGNTKVRFVINKNDTLTLLNDIYVQLYKREGKFDYVDHAYRKQLQTILQECPILDIENSSYTERSLIALLKEYLSFCRIDSRIYLEQKKLGKMSFMAGVFGTSWSTEAKNVVGYGLMAQVLLPRRLNNTFILLDIGGGSQTTSLVFKTSVQIGFYAGKYFGRHAIQGKIYTGFSSIFGFLDTGLGISYRKMISIEARYPVFAGLIFGFKEDGSNRHIQPALTFRAVYPISSLVKK